MTALWVYRSLCGLCLASYWAFYGHTISWRLPITAVLVFALGSVLSEIGAVVFIVSYPVLLYLNQYPQQQFSAATFLAVSLALGLSFRKSAQLWAPLATVLFFFVLTVARYHPDWPSLLQGIWTTEQISPTLFAGTCVMWSAGIMLFDFLRRMKPGWIYYALIAQGAVFTTMAVANIWLRNKPIGQYQFLFGDANAFAGYLILQTGLLVSLWQGKRKIAWPATASILFVLDSLLLVASWSRSGLVAYFATIFLCIVVFAAMWIQRQRRRTLKAAIAVLVVVVPAAAIYEYSQLFAATIRVYEEVKPLLPLVVRREVTTRIVDLRGQFSTRVRMITPDVLYRQRVRDWDVPLTVIGDYPVFGIGVGRFYGNSMTYAKRAHRDQGDPDFFLYYVPENAHNYYLQIAAETGLTGLALFLAFLGWLFSKHLRVNDPVKLGCGIGLLAFMILCVGQHPLLVDRVFFAFVFVCAAMAAGERDEIQRLEFNGFQSVMLRKRRLMRMSKSSATE